MTIRVDELVAAMTLPEKVAQLYGLWVGVDPAGGEMAPHQHELTPTGVVWEELIRDGLGQLTRPFGTAPVEPAAGARALAASQAEVVAAGRFGIPALVHEECLTGLAAWTATIVPSPLCWGATFDPTLIQRMAAHIGNTMRDLGIHQGLAPVLDVARDLRWGRIEETIGEDPYLVGTIGSAYVAGLESAGVIATLKHFVGYSASRAGRNLAPVSIGLRERNDVLLPPFEMALLAGARSVMNSYSDIDGVPVAADPTVLDELLRGEYGFTGTVVSDYFAVQFLRSQHGVAADDGEAAGLALRAGIDVELPTVHSYGAPLLTAIGDGRIPVELVDRALRRVLEQKAELGLLDPGWSPEILSAPVSLDTAVGRGLAAEVARKAIVLVQNSHGLPLSAGARLAVVGPRADAPDAMLGCYSFPRHVGVHHPGLPLGVEIPTVVDALSADFDVTYRQGCPVVGEADDTEWAAAVRAARDADVCVAVLGDVSGLFGVGTSGEGCDATDLRLPGRQEELLEALLDTGTPVVAVLLVGRPYELSRQADRLAATVVAFFPGEAGASALADVLTGRAQPSGRLPISFPGAGTNQPSTYLGGALTRQNAVSTVDPTPLWAFGHGLGYHDVAWGAITASAHTWPIDGTVTLTVELANTFEVPLSEVVQVYLHDPVAEVVRPVQLLLAAPRVELGAHATACVEITLHADQLTYTGRAGRRIVDDGAVQLWVGASSTDIRSRIAVDVIGARREVGFDRVRHACVTIS